LAALTKRDACIVERHGVRRLTLKRLAASMLDLSRIHVRFCHPTRRLGISTHRALKLYGRVAIAAF
jgi:hypothetical protein